MAKITKERPEGSSVLAPTRRYTGVLFGVMYHNTNISSSLSICIWNVWCALNLILAIDRGTRTYMGQYFEM